MSAVAEPVSEQQRTVWHTITVAELYRLQEVDERQPSLAVLLEKLAARQLHEVAVVGDHPAVEVAQAVGVRHARVDPGVGV